MNPIEAMAKAICDVEYGHGYWDNKAGAWHKAINMVRASAALDALAGNVSTGMTRAASESRAIDDEGPFVPLADLLDFSGENKRHTVLKEGIAAAIRAAGEE